MIVEPTTELLPVTRLATPAGNPASSSVSNQAAAVNGVIPAGLTTTVFPHATAGISLRTIVASGKFHGVIRRRKRRSARARAPNGPPR